MAKKTYGVYVWQSNPFSNDDCWTGFDGFTLEAALLIFANPKRHALLTETLSTMEGGEIWLSVQEDVRIWDWCSATLIAKRQYSAGTDDDDDDDDDDERRERAMLAGMAFGVKGYNDVMGY